MQPKIYINDSLIRRYFKGLITDKQKNQRSAKLINKNSLF
jgi:hypothetical protein